MTDIFKYIVVSKDNCPQCTQLKTKLNAKGVDYFDANVDSLSGQAYRQVLIEKGYRSVPQMFEFDIDAVNFLGKHVCPEEILG